MKLVLDRFRLGANTTLGNLTVNGNPECFILEDTDRQLEKNPAAKIPGQTCIPRGTYKVIVTWSNRFKKELPLLVDVPGFSGVRLHPGNRHQDSEGCLLPGTSFAISDGDAIVNNSREAFRRLFIKIEEAIDRGEDITLEVV